MDGFVSVGNSNQPIKVIMMGFTQESDRYQACDLIRSLQHGDQIPAEVELSLLLSGGSATPDGLYLLWLFMPMTLDAYVVAEGVVMTIEQRLNTSLESYDLTPQQQLDYAGVYRRLRKGSGQ
jgi:hypothetical protein